MMHPTFARMVWGTYLEKNCPSSNLSIGPWVATFHTLQNCTMPKWRGRQRIRVFPNNGAVPQNRNGETAVFALCPKSQNGPKIHFLPTKKMNKAKRLIFTWDNVTFLFSQLFMLMARTWSAVESGRFRNPDFCPKIHFFQWDPIFLPPS